MADTTVGGSYVGIMDAARALGLSRSTLHKAVRKGSLVPDMRTPRGHVRFRPQTIEAYRQRLQETESRALAPPALPIASEKAPAGVLAEMARALVAGEDMQEIGRIALDGIRRVMPNAHMGYIARHAPTERDPWRVRMLALDHYPMEAIQAFGRLRPTYEFSLTAALQTGKIEGSGDTATEDVRSGSTLLMRLLQARSYVVLPILADQHPIGVMGVISRMSYAFGPGEVLFLSQVADQLAVAITISARLRSQRAMLEASGRLTMRAQEGRARAGATAPVADLDKLASMYRAASGAYTVCSAGLGVDLMAKDDRIQALARLAAERGQQQVDIWDDNDRPATGLAANIPLPGRWRAAVAAGWAGLRDTPEADLALLVVFGAACLMLAPA
jgi:GAF domain